MICTESWINKYYEYPLKEYENPKEIDTISNELFNTNQRNLNFEKFKNFCFCDNNGWLCCFFRNLVEWTVGIITIIVAFIFVILFIIYFLHDQQIIK